MASRGTPLLPPTVSIQIMNPSSGLIHRWGSSLLMRPFPESPALSAAPWGPGLPHGVSGASVPMLASGLGFQASGSQGAGPPRSPVPPRSHRVTSLALEAQALTTGLPGAEGVLQAPWPWSRWTPPAPAC